MDLDLKRIEAKLQYVKDNLSLLQDMSADSETAFVTDKVKFYAAVHALQVSIEAMLDTFSHIIARLHLGVPTNDRETLEIALTNRLTTKEHFQRFVGMNKFRNKVVHGYLDVDAKTVYQMLQKDLDDFQFFFDDVHRVIEIERAKEKNGKRSKANGNK